jgi:hypothetical protein
VALHWREFKIQMYFILVSVEYVHFSQRQNALTGNGPNGQLPNAMPLVKGNLITQNGMKRKMPEF